MPLGTVIQPAGISAFDGLRMGFCLGHIAIYGIRDIGYRILGNGLE